MRNMSKELRDERIQAFRDAYNPANKDEDYNTSVQEVVEGMSSNCSYFGYEKHNNFYDVTSDFIFNSDYARDKLLSDINKGLNKFGASTNNTVYEVDWGTEPLYIVLSDTSALVAVDLSWENPVVNSFSDLLASDFGNDEAFAASTKSDVEIALKHMGVSYK